MKSLSLMILLTLAPLTSALAEVDCAGRVKIPAQMTADLREPSCIGLDLNAKVAVVSGFVNDRTGQVSLITRAFFLKRGRVLFMNQMSLDQIKPKTISSYAFQMNCGLSLLTARVVNRNEVVLVFDNYTAIRWEVNPSSKGKTYPILSSYDPNTMYFCYGIQPGINTFASQIKMDPRRRVVSLRDLHFEAPKGEVKTARF